MPGNAIRALLVDDDRRLAELVRDYLAQNDIEATLVGDGEGALAAVRDGSRWDVVLLDLMLPGVDGLEVCRRLRAEPRTARVPIIMLTARGDDVDRIVGLELGADDYLGKPYNPRELVARIRAVLRRAAPAAATPAPGDRLEADGLVIDRAARAVTLDGAPVDLTRFEFDLLVLLVAARGRVLTREHLFDRLKDGEFETFDRSIDVHVSKLRQKLGDDPRSPRHIRTVRGVGYVFLRGEAAP
ncbi:MAG: response regulator transcription factor [Deltaproteobacteria bacterium]|nr:response regulator transcription factor [Deltaproteobacteria bacterium]